MSFQKYFAEELKKASDRIKSGKRINFHGKQLSPHEVHAATKSLANSTHLDPKSRKALAAIADKLKNQIDVGQMRDTPVEPYEEGATVKPRNANKEEQQAKIAQWLKDNPDKVESVPQLGHGKQMEGDVNNPKLRSKAAGKTSGGMKDKLMGENIAIRNKDVGRVNDLRTHMKNEQKKIQAGKGPESVIRVPGSNSGKPKTLPGMIPDHYKKDPTINSLLELLNASPPEHHEFIKDELKTHIKKLDEDYKKLERDNRSDTDIAAEEEAATKPAASPQEQEEAKAKKIQASQEFSRKNKEEKRKARALNREGIPTPMRAPTFGPNEKSNPKKGEIREQRKEKGQQTSALLSPEESKRNQPQWPALKEVSTKDSNKAPIPESVVPAKDLSTSDAAIAQAAAERPKGVTRDYMAEAKAAAALKARNAKPVRQTGEDLNPPKPLDTRKKNNL